MSGFWDGVLDVVGSVAPTIATALGGPLAGTAVSALADVFGLSSDDKDGIAKAIKSATPDQLLALKQADYAYQVKMTELGIDLERIAAADRDSARKMQIETGSMIPAVLAALVVMGFFAAQYWIFTQPIPTGAEVIVSRVLGTLDAALMLILAYYYGSSARSSAVLHGMAKRPPDSSNEAGK